jgi:hypothetical protein
LKVTQTFFATSEETEVILFSRRNFYSPRKKKFRAPACSAGGAGGADERPRPENRVFRDFLDKNFPYKK